jgi:hypothetical protein
VVSLTVQIKVESNNNPSDGVFVTLSTDPCFAEGAGNVLKNIWCAAEYDEWICELQLPTAAEHPGVTTFYLDVYGRQSGFSVEYQTGLNNCEVPAASAIPFCASVVDYPVWSVENPTLYDDEAGCFYESLVAAFSRLDGEYCDTVCWTGTSAACRETLAAFACYESFPPCDLNGFITSTCREMCELVESTCSVAFNQVYLNQYDCQSFRYIDAGTAVCGGTNFVGTNSQVSSGDPYDY